MVTALLNQVSIISDPRCPVCREPVSLHPLRKVGDKTFGFLPTDTGITCPFCSTKLRVLQHHYRFAALVAVLLGLAVMMIVSDSLDESYRRVFGFDWIPMLFAGVVIAMLLLLDRTTRPPLAKLVRAEEGEELRYPLEKSDHADADAKGRRRAPVPAPALAGDPPCPVCGTLVPLRVLWHVAPTNVGGYLERRTGITCPSCSAKLRVLQGRSIIATIPLHAINIAVVIWLFYLIDGRIGLLAAFVALGVGLAFISGMVPRFGKLRRVEDNEQLDYPLEQRDPVEN